MKNNFKVLQFAFTDSLRTVFTDFGAILVLVIAALAYPVIYSISYSKQVVTDLNAVVVDNDNSQLSRKCINMLDATPGIKVVAKSTSMEEAKVLFWDNTAHAIFTVPESFEKELLKGNQAALAMYADASNFLYYKETYKAAMRVVNTVSATLEYKKLIAQNIPDKLAKEKLNPLNVQMVNLYNPAGSYGSFVMPGIMLIIIQQTLLIGIGLIGGAGRERKRMVMIAEKVPLTAHPVSLIFGKALAYFFIGAINMLFSSVVVYHWFSYPDKSVAMEVLALAVPFLLSTIFLGLTISVLFRHREHSIMFLVFLTPIILFVSGLSWPVESMPVLLHKLFSVFPAIHMVPAYIRVRTMGVGLSNVQSELMWLWGQTAVYFVLAVIAFVVSTKKNVKHIETI
jgi:ABC-2 type transport system permease protein